MGVGLGLLFVSVLNFVISWIDNLCEDLCEDLIVEDLKLLGGMLIL